MDRLSRRGRIRDRRDRRFPRGARRKAADRRAALPLDRRRRFPGECRRAHRSALFDDAPGRHGRLVPHLRLLERLHGRRPRPVAVLHVDVALRVRDAHPGHGRQLPPHVRGVGGCGPLQLPTHRILVRAARAVLRGEEGLRHEPDRGLGLHDRHHHDLPRLRLDELPGRLQTCRGERPRAERTHAHLPRALFRRDRKVGTAPALLVASGRDGGPDAGLRAHPRGDDGHLGRLSRRPVDAALRRGGLLARGRGRGGRDHRDLRCDDRSRAVRHQARHGLLHREPARLHVPSARRRRPRCRDLPPGDARVLQGAPLPGLRLGDPRARRRAGHAQDGRAPPEDAGDVLDDAHRGRRSRRAPAARRLLVEGRDRRCGVHERARPPLRDRDRHRGPHRVLRDAGALDDLLRRAAGPPPL